MTQKLRLPPAATSGEYKELRKVLTRGRADRFSSQKYRRVITCIHIAEKKENILRACDREL